MRMIVIGLLVMTGAVGLAAPEQTLHPGQMTEARVWVQNRGASEALPVDLRDVNTDRPLRVEVMNGDGGRAVPVLVTRHAWEYKSIVVGANNDLTAALNQEGIAGWETTGVTFVTQDRTTTVLLKRPR